MTALVTARPLRNYAEYARIGFVNILAFRLRYYTGIVTYLINVTVYYYIWKALYANDPEFARGFSFPEMVTYVAVGWVIRSVYFNNVDQNMAADVQEGNIVMAMLKPASVQTMYLGRALGEASFRLIMLTVPAGAVIFLLFPVQAPAGAEAAALFSLSLAGSVLLSGALNFIVGCFAIRMKSILGLLRAKFYVQELLSGLLIPMTMFPPAVEGLLGWLPFQHIAYTPLRLYLGKLGGAAAWTALGVQWAWALALFGFGGWFWRFMARKLTVQGG